LCLAASIGVILVIIGRRIHVPSIVLLLLGGIGLGPEGAGLIDPSSLGAGLETIVALAVAVILFEGGLTLDTDGYKGASAAIRRLVTIGPLITWLGAAYAVWLLTDLNMGMSLMAGSLVVVTGPTVISPLLRHIGIRERLHHVLYWEGVLIDAVGVFLAVLCYEYLTPTEYLDWIGPIGRFVLRLVVGVAIGVVAGLVITLSLKKGWVPDEHVNIFVLACALLTFALAHMLLSESGILAVVVAGLVVGLKHPPRLRHVKRFKLEITEIGIGLLFVLLSARLELDRFQNWRLIVLLVVLMLILRPVCIWVSTWGQGFLFREKVLLSWIAPRGIVAAAMASLFALRLGEQGHAGAEFLETFTYTVIMATVTLQGLSARFVTRLLGLERRNRRTWVIMGEGPIVEALGRGLRRAGVKTIEVTNLLEDTEELDPEEPRFVDTQAILYANTTPLQNLWSMHRWPLPVESSARYRWATWSETERNGQKRNEDSNAGTPVWKRTQSVATVVEGLATGQYTIDVLEVGEGRDHENRFGASIQPLFWVRDGKAQIVADPINPGEPRGDMAVVLRSRVAGLADLVAHVEVIQGDNPDLDEVLTRLGETAVRLYPEMPIAELIQGIQDRHGTMPAAVGSGVAIPHAYCEGLDKPRCFLAVAPDGMRDMVTPDGVPVRLIFLLISPLGQASAHIESLAAIGALGQEQGFMDLLARQRAPERIALLINERS
jgi:NhaP-type Na+/H+ or K+/H+ antiporter/mannitol/fructose-specific phosphotransferase system IIA component (Ntr-type)